LRRTLARLLLVGGTGVVLHGLARLLRQARPARAEVERAADPGRRSDPLLVRGGARRVIAAEADARDAYVVEVDVVPAGERLERPFSSASRARSACRRPFSTHAGSHSSHAVSDEVTRWKSL